MGDPVFLSVRPEKIRISRERPAGGGRHNIVPARVEDVIYLGPHTKFWVRAGEYRLAVDQQHSRFLLDEKPIRWEDEVWISWHADDGFMLERYSEADESLMDMPAPARRRRETTATGDAPAAGAGDDGSG